MKSIKNTVIVAIVVFTVVLSFVQISLNILTFKRVFRDTINTTLTFQAEKEASYLNSKFSKWGDSGQSYASTIGVMPGYDTDILLSILKKHIENDDLIIGGGFWLQPYEYDKEHKYYGPYMHKDGNTIKTTWDYSTAKEDYFQYDWYKDGFEIDKSVIWSEPYADPITGVPMITATSAIEKTGEKVGVITLDIGLDELQQYVSNIKIGQEGYAFVVTSEGYYLANRDTDKNLNMRIIDEEDEKLKEFGNKILSGDNSSVNRIKLDNDTYLSVFAPIGDTGLNVVVFIPQSEVFRVINRTFYFNAGILIISLVLLVIMLSQIITRMVINPLKVITKDAERITEGDLTRQENLVQYYKKDNEIGLLARAFINMIENIHKLVSEIKTSTVNVVESCQELDQVSSGVSASSKQISITVSELAQGVSEQASNTQDGSLMIGEIIKKLRGVTQETKVCEELTANSMMIMEESSGKIEYQKEKMIESKNATIKVANAINNLSNKSLEIGEIVNTIDGIAEQTNLLALNAAIEAARAGEHGKGFAVVADEVRKLAEQSSNSTQKINELIKDIQNGIENAVEEMKNTESTIGDQEKSVEEIVKSFAETIASVQEVSDKIRRVSEDSDMLNESAGKVVETIENLASISEESAAATEEVAATTEQNTISIQRIGSEIDKLTQVIDKLENGTEKFII
ncbi:MAG: methyl-accepting chemotaxis protein [Maledivibacter sp.]|jgi:methyl-accepting chemotaxis protein|nr:methyl-accepting chemotaxis protein [Maledivibacter sp.]